MLPDTMTTEMGTFTAMLARAGIPFHSRKDGSGTEVHIGLEGDVGMQLIVGPTGGASFQFDECGTLIRLELSGD